MNLIKQGLILMAYALVLKTTTADVLDKYHEYRRDKTKKDADLLIKMSADFIKDMQQKMNIIKRTGVNYAGSVDFMIGASYDDIQRRFKHMCDLYHQYATVNRYVLGNELNDTAPNWDVVVLYQIMLSDYNEIMMLSELVKKEKRIKKTNAAEDDTKDVVKKQLAKFASLDVPPPKIKEEEEKVKPSSPASPASTTPAQGRRWVRHRDADYPHYPQKWSGELDGIGFDNR
ncbi:uncharacterized protein LOC134802445 [Cydia splendana]|uniref:uncharacterized protein LOC134802445 n=1 Tax=Cydia splendana TaxID=1100963 RepID=UPI0028F4B905